MSVNSSMRFVKAARHLAQTTIEFAVKGDFFPNSALLSSCKGIGIPESGKFLLVESGTKENYTFGIRNLGFWNREYSSRNSESTNDKKTES